MTDTKEEPVGQRDLFVKLVGHIGKWQIWLCIIIFLIKFPSAWYQLAIIYLAPTIDFQCNDTKSNHSMEVFDSTCHSNCTEYIYDTSVFENTIISEWGLICDRAWLKDFTQTVLMFGMLVGSIAFGFLADRFGRRKAFLTAVIVLIVFGIGTAFSPDYITFTILRFMVGFASGGTMMTSFVLCMEIVGSEYRVMIGILYQIPFVLGHMTLPAFAYYLRSWNTYSLGLTIPSLIYLAYFWLLPESPRWLIANGKINEATDIILKAATMNKLPTEGINETVKQISQELEANRENLPKANFGDLFRNPVLRIKTTCSCMMWLFCGLYFFGVSQYISQTSSNIFISVLVSGSVQLPGDLSVIYINKVFGRKKTTIVTLIISSISMFIIGFINLPSWLRLTTSSVGMCSISMAFCTMYVYSTELFPTVVRNMGMGLASTSSRVGSMVAPFVSGLAISASWLPPAIFGMAPLIAVICCFMLPETSGTKLPDSLTDGERKT